jgi:MFS family permease
VPLKYNISFRYYIGARLFIMLALHIQMTIVGLQLYYEYDRSAYALGLLGLFEAAPFMVLSLVSGYVSDLYNRKTIWMLCIFGFFLASLFLYANANHLIAIPHLQGKAVLYTVTFFLGILRAFTAAAVPPLLSQIVVREHITKAATWSATSWYIGGIAGPAIGAYLYGTTGASISYQLNCACFLIGLVLIGYIKTTEQIKADGREAIFTSIAQGVKFVLSNKIILGAMSLDMLGVLFGDAIALLPVFSDKVLHLAPEYYGYLRMAPTIGALLTSLVLAKYTPLHNTGNKLLICMACFGVLNILMGLSTTYFATFVVLFVAGMADNVSVVIRHAIMQLMTPDAMRGRVSAINSIFIGSSNEIGAYECGAVARAIGLVPAIVFGGSVTIVVTIVIAIVVPTLRKFQLKNHQ